MLVAVLTASAAGVYAWQVWLRPPSAARLVATLKETRARLTQLSCTIRIPWPEAYPAGGGIPGARTLLAPPEGERLTSVRWLAGTGMRVEILEPSDAAGSLTVHDGSSWWTYSPLLNLALVSRADGPPPLFIDELLSLIEASPERERRVLGRGAVDGHAVFELSCRLLDGGELRVDVDARAGVPLRARRFDPEGRLLGVLEVSDLSLSPGIAAAEFAFTPPAGARVIAESLPQPYPDVAAAAAAGLGFAPRTPTPLPKGFALAAVNLLGTGQSRALVLTYTRTAGEGAVTDALFTLTETLAGAGWSPLPYGRPESRTGWQGQVFELGDLNGVDWRSGELAMTLFGTVLVSELIAIALTVR